MRSPELETEPRRGTTGCKLCLSKSVMALRTGSETAECPRRLLLHLTTIAPLTHDEGMEFSGLESSLERERIPDWVSCIKDDCKGTTWSVRVSALPPNPVLTPTLQSEFCCRLTSSG